MSQVSELVDTLLPSLAWVAVGRFYFFVVFFKDAKAISVIGKTMVFFVVFFEGVVSGSGLGII